MPFKIVKFLNQAVSYSLIVELKTTNIFLLCSWCKYVCFSAFYDIYSLCFAVGTRTAVHNCHVACRQRKPAICTSIVYGSDRVNTKQIFHFLKLVQCSNSAQETYVISLKPKRRCFVGALRYLTHVVVLAFTVGNLMHYRHRCPTLTQ